MAHVVLRGPAPRARAFRLHAPVHCRMKLKEPFNEVIVAAHIIQTVLALWTKSDALDLLPQAARNVARKIGVVL